MSGSKGNILVVDDEHLVRWSVCRFLEGEGFTALEAATGNEALQVLETREIQVLVTDLMMPEMDGIELIRRAKARKPHLPVLVITANDSPGTISSARDAGAINTFSKPIPFNDLVGAIQKVV